MTTSDRQGFVRSLVCLARTELVRARLDRLEAEFAVDFREVWGLASLEPEGISLFRDDARESRKLARLALQLAEKVNGLIFMEENDPIPLFWELDGRHYRDWPEYKIAIQDRPHLRGS